jgi:hypothetical protein
MDIYATGYLDNLENIESFSCQIHADIFKIFQAKEANNSCMWVVQKSSFFIFVLIQMYSKLPCAVC